jgi:CRP-like cAMP-binding protein
MTAVMRKDPSKLREAAASAVARGKHKTALALYAELEELEPTSPAWPKRIGETQRRMGDADAAIGAFERAVEKYVLEGLLVQAIGVCKLILQIAPDRDAIARRLAQLATNGPRSAAMPETVSPTPTTRDAEPTSRPRSVVTPATPVASATPAAPAIRTPATAASTAPSAALAMARRAATSPEEKGVPRRGSLPPATRLPSDQPITLPRGGALDAIPLAAAMPDSTPVTREDGSFSGMSVLRVEIPFEDIAEVSEVQSPTQLALLRTPLFAEVAPATLERLISHMALFELAPGDVIFHEGEPGASLFVIAEGEVSVETGGHELGRLSAGAFFGELALVTDLPRSATVRAIGRVELLGLDRELVRQAAAEHPQIIQVLLRFMRERLVDRITRTSELFEPFTDEERRRLAGNFDVIEAEAGTSFIVQGKRADGLYIVMAGRVEVLRDGTTAPIATLHSGDVFGEISLLGGHGSTANVRTTSRVLALRMDAITFREVIMTYPQVLAYLGELSSRRSAPQRAEEFVDLHIDLI